jgi:hypothetical protein
MIEHTPFMLLIKFKINATKHKEILLLFFKSPCHFSFTRWTRQFFNRKTD